MASHAHWEGGPVCDLTTKKACDERFANWQAARQVALAHDVVAGGREGRYRRDNTVFGQLVQVVAGLKDTITAGDGEESRNAFAVRVMAMLERYRQEFPDG